MKVLLFIILCYSLILKTVKDAGIDNSVIWFVWINMKIIIYKMLFIIISYNYYEQYFLFKYLIYTVLFGEPWYTHKHTHTKRQKTLCFAQKHLIKYILGTWNKTISAVSTYRSCNGWSKNIAHSALNIYIYSYIYNSLNALCILFFCTTFNMNRK